MNMKPSDSHRSAIAPQATLTHVKQGALCVAGLVLAPFDQINNPVYDRYAPLT